jgi:hypothetical protein
MYFEQQLARLITFNKRCFIVSLHICLDYYYLKKCARNTTTKKRVIFTNFLFVEKLNIIEPILINIGISEKKN